MSDTLAGKFPPTVIDAEVVSQQIVPPRERERAGVLLAPVMNIEQAKKRLEEFQQFIKFYLVEGEDGDYGVIPGTKKPTLFKSGADKLCELYGLADDYKILTQAEDFGAEPPLFDYTIKCILTSRRDDSHVASGLGSCNSYEAKYRWRESNRKCPKCGKETIIKGKEEYGGGWLCWTKKNGCGAKFFENDQSIISQSLERTNNPDLSDLKNTVLKMAKKRAKVDATLAATRSSGIFTQDMDDIATEQAGIGSKEMAQKVAERKISERHVQQESIIVTRWKEGTYALNGHGLAILSSNVQGGIMSIGAVWADVSKTWFLPEDKIDDLKAICQKYQITLTLPQEATTRPQTSAPGVSSTNSPPQTGQENGASSSGDRDAPIISTIAEKKGKNGKYLSVIWGGKPYSCFEAHLFPKLKAAMGKPVQLDLLANNKGYENIVDIISIDGIRFDQKADDPNLDFAPVTDEDIGF